MDDCPKLNIPIICSPCWRLTTALHLSVPAGREGRGLHQPPRVQNRPRHRVQTEIVSVPHVSPKLLIKRSRDVTAKQTGCTNTKTLISFFSLTDCSAFKACHPKIKSFFFATDCLEEMNRWAAVLCRCQSVSGSSSLIMTVVWRYNGTVSLCEKLERRRRGCLFLK